METHLTALTSDRDIGPPFDSAAIPKVGLGLGLGLVAPFGMTALQNGGPES